MYVRSSTHSTTLLQALRRAHAQLLTGQKAELAAAERISALEAQLGAERSAAADARAQLVTAQQQADALAGEKQCVVYCLVCMLYALHVDSLHMRSWFSVRFEPQLDRTKKSLHRFR